MQREWKDPRDGTVWLVTLSPLGTTFDDPIATGPRNYTVSFHKAGTRPRWTAYTSDHPLDQVSDQELMDLLDAAPMERSATHHPNPVRSGPTPADPVAGPATLRRAEG